MPTPSEQLQAIHDAVMKAFDRLEATLDKVAASTKQDRDNG